LNLGNKRKATFASGGFASSPHIRLSICKHYLGSGG
jgi:hypothetical protein